MNLEFFIAKRIILGKKHQSSLTKSIANIAIIGISIGVAVMILTFAVTTGFQKEVKKKIAAFSSDIVIIADEGDYSYENTPISSKQKFYPELNNHPEFKHIQAFATKPGIIKTKENMQGVVLKGVGHDFDWNNFHSNLTEGEVLKISDTSSSNGAIISKKIAQNLHLKIGSKFIVHFVTKAKEDDTSEEAEFLQYKHRKYPFFVTGIYETGMMAEVDEKFVLIDLKHIQKINGWGKEKVGGYEVFVNDQNLGEKTQNIFEKDAVAMKRKADIIFDDYFFLDSGLKAETLYERFPSMMNWLDYLDTYIVIIIIIILIISIINMSSSLLILILEKTQMIGLLKGFGMQNSKIRKVFMYQSMFLIGRGLFFGNLFGIGLCLLQLYTGLIPLDKSAYYLDTMPVNLNLFHLIAINVITVFTCIIMLIIPSFFVAKIDPVKAIRFN